MSNLPILPPKLLDRIIDHLHDDTPTLCTLALVCRQTLVTSRTHLALRFGFFIENRNFDLFLELMDVPWSSLSHAIQSLHLALVFHNSSRYNMFSHERDASRVAENLRNVKTLKVTMIGMETIAYLPIDIEDLLFTLKITHLHINGVMFWSKVTFVQFFAGLQPSIKSMSIVRLLLPLPYIPTIRDTTFLRPFHFGVLDTQSLLNFEKVWDPLSNKDLAVTVDSFLLRVCDLDNIERDVEAVTPFISRFLHHVGPSLRHLFINVSDRNGDSYSLQYLVCVDISQCTNLRILHIGTIEIDHAARGGDSHEENMLTVMWALLGELASSSHPLEEIVVLFAPFTDSDTDQSSGVAEIETFGWVELAGRLQSMFQHLKAIRFGVGYHPSNSDESAVP